MFFMFYISVLIFYISGTNNYVLKKKHIQEEITDLEDNKNLMNVQDVQNNSRVFPTYKPLFQIIHDLTNTKGSNLKSNVFDKRLSDEMFSIKHHEYEKNVAYTTPNLVNPKSSLATPTLELKQKWPIVNLLFPAENVPGSLQYIDEFEKMYLINSTTEQNEMSTTENAVAIKNDGDTDDQDKAKDKVVGLRSLSAHTASLKPSRMYHSIAIKQCTCAKTNPTTTRSALRTGSNTPHKCTAAATGSTKDCTRKTVSSSITPFYVPYNILSITTDFPSFYYPPGLFNEVAIPEPPKYHKPPRPSIEDDLYYEDSFEREKYDNERYVDDDYLEHDSESLKKFKWKDDDDYVEHERECTQNKHKGKHDKDNVVIIDYDNEPEKNHKGKHDEDNVVIIDYDNEPDKNKNISWNTKIHNENPEQLADDIINDLKTNYSDTIIKTCYCASSSCNTSLTFCLYYLCLFMLKLFK